jgi:hypothetical protein
MDLYRVLQNHFIKQVISYTRYRGGQKRLPLEGITKKPASSSSFKLHKTQGKTKALHLYRVFHNTFHLLTNSQTSKQLHIQCSLQRARLGESPPPAENPP